MTASVDDDCLQQGFSRNSVGRWHCKLPQRSVLVGLLILVAIACVLAVWLSRTPANAKVSIHVSYSVTLGSRNVAEWQVKLRGVQLGG